MERKALKNETKARSPQVFRPTEPEGLLLKIPTLIENYLRRALKTEEDDEAERYIMAARILFMAIKPLMDLRVSVTINRAKIS